MKRHLFTLVSALSLLLFVAVVVMWARSYRVHHYAAFRHTELASDGAFTFAQWGIGSRVGVVYLNYGTGAGATREYRAEYDGFRVTSRSHDGTSAFDSGFPASTVRWRLGRMVWVVDERFPPLHLCFLTFPAWSLAVLLRIAPAYSLYRIVWRRHIAREGRCLQCGYDLRATPERCPECGTSAWGRAPAGRRTNSWPPRLIGSMLDIEKPRPVVTYEAGPAVRPNINWPARTNRPSVQ